MAGTVAGHWRGRTHAWTAAAFESVDDLGLVGADVRAGVMDHMDADRVDIRAGATAAAEVPLGHVANR